MGGIPNSTEGWSDMPETGITTPTTEGAVDVPMQGMKKSALDDDTKDKTLSFGEYSLSIDEVYRDIKRLTLSRNPLDLIFKANEIREKFAFFINSLASFISQSFSSFEDDSFINELYHDSKYHHVWMELAYPCLRDIHYCNNRFDTIKYMKKNEDGTTTEHGINKNELLKRFDKNMMNDDDFLAVKTLIQIIIDMYRENKNHERRWERQDILCGRDTSFEKRQLHTACRNRILDAKKELTNLIPHFPYEKENFRDTMEAIFEDFNLSPQDREELRVFAFKEITDQHYPEILYIFFDTSLPFIKEKKSPADRDQFLTKNNWLRLKGMQELTIDTIGAEQDELSNKTKNQEYFKHILNCKELILDLENSILSPILLPVILKLVASAMTLDRKEFYKFSYILLFLFANSYENEYIPLSRFLNELEVYINFNNRNRSLEKLKIGFSLVMLFVLFVVTGYFLLPPLVYIPGVVLVTIYLKMYFLDNYTFSAGIQYNLGMRLWSTALLAIFGYLWITNIGAYTPYYANLQKQLEGFGNKIVAEILPPEKIAEGVKYGAASLLEWKKK
ncbi:MAG: hypothetical protein PHH70_03830 [Candidatus Gracilibacteria bacterium]|nr:hypothetical protein [Candidatus Gracilibacteria bacterium]